MVNAKTELTQHVTDIKNAFNIKIKCAECFSVNTDGILEIFTLPINHTNEEVESFYDLFDFEYFNMLEFTEEMVLTGTVWWSDGSWSVRDVLGEYEDWIYYRAPDIPKCLKRNNTNNIVKLFTE